MKKILLISLLSLLATGCASSFQQAQVNCQQAGFKPGTEVFLSCIKSQTKPKVTFGPVTTPYRYESYGPRSLTCHQMGYHTVCDRF